MNCYHTYTASVLCNNHERDTWMKRLEVDFTKLLTLFEICYIQNKNIETECQLIWCNQVDEK